MQQILTKLGILNVPQWYESGRVWQEQNPNIPYREPRPLIAPICGLLKLLSEQYVSEEGLQLRCCFYALHCVLCHPRWQSTQLYPQRLIRSHFGAAAALLFVEFGLAGWVESKRWADYFNPGSQGDGSFLGLTDALKGQSNGYPGGPFFDPLGTPLKLSHLYSLRCLS